jgi:aryl-alcohol dehydrogenase-like predicted oxidoreductase
MTELLHPIGLGTAQWGMRYGVANIAGEPSLNEICEILELAHKNGISTLDTARSYGRSEQQIGRALKISGLSFRIITKLDSQVHLAGDSWNESERKVNASVQKSLSTIGVDQLDTLLLHRPENRFAFDGELWSLLLKLRDRGMIRKLGVSAVTPEDAISALSDSTVEIVQVASNLLDTRLIENNFFEIAKSQSVEVHIRSTYLQGLAYFDSKNLPEYFNDAKDAFRTIQGLADANGVSSSALWLNHSLRLGSSCVLIGCESAAQLASNLEQAEILRTLQIDSFYELIPTVPNHIFETRLWPNKQNTNDFNQLPTAD